MPRGLVSIPSDIAEGAARQRSKGFIQYLHASQESLSELDPQLEIANRLGWVQKKDGDGLESAMNRMDKILSGVIRHQKTSRPSCLTPHAKTNPQSIRKGVE